MIVWLVARAFRFLLQRWHLNGALMVIQVLIEMFRKQNPGRHQFDTFRYKVDSLVASGAATKQIGFSTRFSTGFSCPENTLTRVEQWSQQGLSAALFTTCYLSSYISCCGVR